MTKRSSFADVKLDVEAGANPLPAAPEPDTPFRILLMGDFGGNAGGSRWRPVEIDRDNFDEVLARSGAGVPKLSMSFKELDDFHPDQIYRSGLFQALREVRNKLEKPATFAEAAAEIRGWRGAPAPAKPAAPAAPAGPAPAGGSLLDSILGVTESSPPRPARRRDDLQAFVESVAAQSTVPAAAADLPQMRTLFNAEASERMRAILHYPAFQAVEAAWRAVFRLVRGIDTDTQLKIHLLDVSKAELEADLNATDDLRGTQIWRVVVADAVGTPGADPWAVVAGNYTFGTTVDDASILGRMGRMMRASGSPFIAEADPRHEVTEEWARLRRSQAARWVGLAMPRFLLRAPYGKNTDSIDSFDFEEMTAVPEHPHYLWGNPAFACVQMLAEAFSDAGWEMSPGKHSTISGLPLHVFEADGDKQVKPCAETLLTERETEWILNQGYMPLVSIKGRDTVRLLRFQSIAEPVAALSGRWG